jgi:hypothetical protein
MQKVTLDEFLKSISFSQLSAQALREMTGREYATPREYMGMLGLADGTWMASVFETVKREIRGDCLERIAPNYKSLDTFKTKLSEEETHSLCAEATMAVGRRITELYGCESTQWEMNVMPLEASAQYREQFMTEEPEEGLKKIEDFGIKVDRESFLARVRNKLFDYLAKTYDYPKDMPEPVAAAGSLFDSSENLPGTPEW